MNHPPIPIEQLAQHIETLKANDGLKFSQEYESIEPGQQFTWDNSNMEVNKPKNRYANVIAYDHSRVVLPPLDGMPGSDYINANYMDGYRKQNAYIATQVCEGNQGDINSLAPRKCGGNFQTHMQDRYLKHFLSKCANQVKDLTDD